MTTAPQPWTENDARDYQELERMLRDELLSERTKMLAFKAIEQLKNFHGGHKPGKAENP